MTSHRPIALAALFVALVANSIAVRAAEPAPPCVGPCGARPAGVAADGIAVFPGHPRLIVGGYRGVSVEALRAACAHGDMHGECDRIGGRHVLDDAMRYLLTGDAAAAGRAKATLLGGVTCGDGYEQTPAGGHALAYDWVHDTLAADERRQIEATLADCGTNIARSLRGNSPHLWHGFTSQAAALALVALAIDDHPAREGLRADAAELFRGRALEAYAVVGGACPEGYSYLRTHFFSGDPPYQYVIDALRAWDSAVAQDHPDHASLFETIAVEEGDWLRGLAWHLVHGTVPPSGPGGKPTFLRGGDMPTGQAYPNRQYRPFVDSIARVYGDPALAAWGRELEAYWSFVGGEGTYHPIHRYSLPYNLPIDVPSESGVARARGRIWGRDDLGYVITRSWWAEDAAIIGYRAGKWFTGHQHMDQGHLDVWRNGPLAVDAGVYAGWGTVHREAYYSRSVAHNTLLVPMPGETFEQHPGLSVAVNDAGQRIQTHNRRGCAQCIQSVAEWRANIGAGMHFEAGRIDAFADFGDYAYIASDLTAAYNSTSYVTPGNAPKVEVVQRDVLFIRPSLIFVIDRVRTLPGAGAPRFTLHLPARPRMADLQVVDGTVDDGVLETDARTFAVDNGTGGTLHGQTVWPEEARATITGGQGHRYWVDGANRDSGAEGLEGAPAAPGSWRIEVAPSTAPATGGAAEVPADHLLVHALWAVGTDDPAGVGGWNPAGVERLPAELDPVDPLPVLALLARDSRLSAMSTDVVIVASGAVPRSPVRFASIGPGVPGMQHVLVLGAVPGAAYRIGMPGTIGAEATADAEGLVWALAVGGPGLVVAACPPADGAGQAWRLACGGPPGEPSVTPPTAGSTATAGATAGPSPTGTLGAQLTPTAGATAGPGAPPQGCFLPLAER